MHRVHAPRGAGLPHPRRSLLRGLVCAGALLLGAVASAQSTGSVNGRVKNAQTGEFLRNAVISAAGGQTAQAGPGGYYRLNNLPAGPLELTATYSGLDLATATVTVPVDGAVTFDFDLRRGEDGVVELDAFTVNSQREGNARAIMEQRYAINPKKVIAADAIGNVSEGNVGEFLKLMPGVTMDYVEADTRSVRVRGLNPKYANVLLDGMQLASAGSSSIGTGRAYEFEQLSIADVETVELTKNPTPDQPSSVAGTVNLRTKGAFDREGRRISWSTSLSTNSYYASLDKTAGWDDQRHRKLFPNYALEYSDVLLEGKLGVLANLGHSETIAAQKHIWFWMDAFDADPTNNATEVPRINWIWLQDGPKPTVRDNYSVRFDLRPSERLHLYSRIGYNGYDASFYNRTLSLRPDRVDGALAYAPGATKTDMTVTRGRISTDSNQFMEKLGNTLTWSGGAYYVNGGFEADLGLQHVRQKNWYANLESGHFTDFSSSISGVSWRMTRPSAGSTDVNFQQLSGPNWRDLNNYTFDANSLAWHERNAQDEKTTLRADLRHTLERGEITHLVKYGVMSTSQDLVVRRYGAQRTNPVGADRVFGTADDPRPAAFVDPRFQANWGFTNNMNAWPALSPWALYADYIARPSHYIDSPANALNRIRDNWFFEEQIHAAYLQDKISWGRTELSPGVRYEYTDSEGRGTNRTTNTIVTGGDKYGELLWYLQGSHRFTEDLVFRASYHSAITRADIANLVPGISSIDDTNRVLSASNPNLRPENSRTLEARLEYYFKDVGYLSVAVFQSEVDDRQASSRQTLGSGGWGGDPDYAGWELISTFNVGTSTTYRGVEIDYSQQLSRLPGWMAGLGIFANLTRLDYDNPAFYFGSPETIANGGFSYSGRRLGGRLNANYLGRSLIWQAAANEYNRDRLQLDLNLEFKINERLTAFADARNLTNAPSQYTYRAVEENFMRILRTGTIWMVGMKGTF